jgi:hypothetical protein
MAEKHSLLCSQNPIIGPRPGPDEFSSHPQQAICKINFNIILPDKPR